mgnify:FL=1
MAFNILSLSGGGYLGLYTATVLAELEDQYGQPLASKFDLLAGTSIGGIIALGLAANKPAEEIKRAFERNGESIFSSRPQATSGPRKLWDINWSSKYDGTGLRKAVSEVIDTEMLIGDLRHRVIIPTVNLTKGTPQLFKTPHHEDFRRDHKIKVSDVAVATSAAPTYFPVAEIGDELFADGGLYANAPDQLAVHEAEYFLEIPIEEINVLSIGTTTTQFSMSHVTQRDLGIVGWGSNLASTIISSQQMLAVYMLEHRLGKRYVRIDTIQSAVQERDLGLDVATKDAQQTIRGLASGAVQAVLNNPKVNQIMKSQAPNPKFFYGKFADKDGGAA